VLTLAAWCFEQIILKAQRKDPQNFNIPGFYSASFQIVVWLQFSSEWRQPWGGASSSGPASDASLLPDNNPNPKNPKPCARSFRVFFSFGFLCRFLKLLTLKPLLGVQP
jgi:hypothetical protein